jgi:hypothetical protein
VLQVKTAAGTGYKLDSGISLPNQLGKSHQRSLIITSYILLPTTEVASPDSELILIVLCVFLFISLTTILDQPDCQPNFAFDRSGSSSVPYKDLVA